jgi:hypothetical protein
VCETRKGFSKKIFAFCAKNVMIFIKKKLLNILFLLQPKTFLGPTKIVNTAAIFARIAFFFFALAKLFSFQQPLPVSYFGGNLEQKRNNKHNDQKLFQMWIK